MGPLLPVLLIRGRSQMSVSTLTKFSGFLTPSPFVGILDQSTGISSEIRTKLRDWAVGQAGAGCYSLAALSSNDSKTLYSTKITQPPLLHQKPPPSPSLLTSFVNGPVRCCCHRGNLAWWTELKRKHHQQAHTAKSPNVFCCTHCRA